MTITDIVMLAFLLLFGGFVVLVCVAAVNGANIHPTWIVQISLSAFLSGLVSAYLIERLRDEL